MLQIFNHKGTLIGMSVSVLEADVQCKHKIKVIMSLRNEDLACSVFPSPMSVSHCIMAPLLACMTEMTPIDWSVSQL